MTSTHAAITGITRGPRDLAFPPSTPSGEQWIYQLAMPFQLSPTEAALIANIRLGKTRVVDLEVGSDLVIFDDFDAITADRAVALNRYRYENHPRTGEKLMMVPSPAGGAFVPLGAKRPDGSPHPHAGTGFGLGPLQGYPTELANRTDTHIDVNSDVHMRLELLQYAYDGRNFSITHRQELASDALLTGTHVLFLGMGMGIPSGDDLLTGINTGTFGAWDSGIARWRRDRDGRWKIVEHKLIAPTTHEPSIVRDVDGSLLMAFRPWGTTNKEPLRLHIERSTDEGKTWQRICAVEPFWQMCPVTINRALDGRPYVCANRFREPRTHKYATREMLHLWPLSDDRNSLLDPIVVRDGPSEWGPTPNGSVWRMDHPMGSTVRLKDGQWHHVLAYRVLDDAEMRTDAGATPMTGCYVEELFSAGTPRPTWPF